MPIWTTYRLPGTKSTVYQRRPFDHQFGSAGSPPYAATSSFGVAKKLQPPLPSGCAVATFTSTFACGAEHPEPQPVSCQVKIEFQFGYGSRDCGRYAAFVENAKLHHWYVPRCVPSAGWPPLVRRRSSDV